ncbi:MAG: ABC transporter permease [Acidobacteria bacterium]|nr:ABC transporter permease [Acidobacteriota bacterium]
MNTLEALSRSLDNLRTHTLRSALSILGMIFGVGAVIAMLAIGAGAEKQALENIQKMGLSNVIVKAKTFRPDDLAEIRKKSPGLSLRDVAGIEEGIPEVAFAGPTLLLNPYRVAGPFGRSEAKIKGVSHRHAELLPLPLEEGRFLDLEDERTYAQVCVLGPAARRDLFGWEPALGRTVKANDVWLTVVGVLAASEGTGPSASAGSEALDIYVPFTTALRKFDRDPMDSPLAELVVKLDPGASAQDVAGSVTGLLTRLHGGVNDFEIVVPEALLAQSRKTQRLFTLVMGAIAGISLLVGGIGIMNIMLASVLERTREIGIRRALGARRFDIRFQFVVESFALSVLGGVLGILAGLAISKVVASSAGWPTIVTFWSVALSSGVAAAVGLASGIYPATRAASLDPIEALRYE